MHDRSESWIAALVLAAMGLVLFAPVIGSTGHAGAADVVMVLAAACGLGAFVIAARSTLRAARSLPRASREEDPK